MLRDEKLVPKHREMARQGGDLQMKTFAFADSASTILCAVIRQHSVIGLACALAIVAAVPVTAGVPECWETRIGPGTDITVIGTSYGRYDGYDGSGPLILDPESVGVFILAHHVENDEHGWDGPTGFYPEEFESPIPPGASKTWWDIYLWSQNTPGAPNQFEMQTRFESGSGPPDGYVGHLVIEQVPTGVTWTGPVDYWFDMTVFNTFSMPIATVTDPLQGTRFYLTVYAPIPEPSALCALGFGLAGLAAVRRRKR